MSRTLNETMDWIDESTETLSEFLQSYVKTPEEGALPDESMDQIANLILVATQFGTNAQIKMLYLLLLETRSELRKGNEFELYQSISQLTQFFKHHCPGETNQAEEELLNPEPHYLISADSASAA